MDRWEARKQETALIEKYATLEPEGFNRRRDNPEINRVKHKVEVGRTYGHAVVINYWPDADRMKVYRMRCECGRELICKWSEITDELNCGCKGGCGNDRIADVGSRNRPVCGGIAPGGFCRPDSR